MLDAVFPLRVKPTWKRARRVWLRLAHDQRAQAGVAGALLALLVVSVTMSVHGRYSRTESEAVDVEEVVALQYAGPSSSLFIAIGSAPGNVKLRNAARSGWLKWLPDDMQVSYRFFTDAAPPESELRVNPASRPIWDAVRKESSKSEDLVMQPLPTGYGDKEHNAYAKRARYQVKWALQHVKGLDFFLRIDDDSFLCLHKLLYELKSLPRRQFVWGRFWCREGRNRADENFLFFSRDVVQLLADDNFVGGIVPYDDEVTLGWNLGYWSWVLNLTIFDDQRRLDAQQGYLTQYMHQPAAASPGMLSQFCEKHIYAHHVKADTMRAAFAATKTHLMYPLPDRVDPTETCHRQTQSFVPARHSSALPDLLITRSAHAS